MTVRVPTHQDGKALYWEFATDYYDIGFGVFFEWVEPEDTQVNFFNILQCPNFSNNIILQNLIHHLNTIVKYTFSPSPKR